MADNLALIVGSINEIPIRYMLHITGIWLPSRICVALYRINEVALNVVPQVGYLSTIPNNMTSLLQGATTHVNLAYAGASRRQFRADNVVSLLIVARIQSGILRNWLCYYPGPCGCCKKFVTAPSCLLRKTISNSVYQFENSRQLKTRETCLEDV